MACSARCQAIPKFRRILPPSQPSSRLRDQNLGELRNPHGSDCWVRYGSNNFGQNGGMNDDKGKDYNYLGSGGYTEKAGVGGSTPSLATIIPKNLAEWRLALPVRSQSAVFRRDPVRFLATMMVKDFNSHCPRSDRFQSASVWNRD